MSWLTSPYCKYNLLISTIKKSYKNRVYLNATVLIKHKQCVYSRPHNLIDISFIDCEAPS